MTAMAPAEQDLARYLATKLGWLRLNVNALPGPVRPYGGAIPHEAVFFTPVGGITPEDFVGMSTSIMTPRVQIRYRAPKKSWESIARARELLRSAHQAPIDGYIDVRSAESDPTPLGEDEDDHPEWTINIDMQIRE